jgi:hypothetical protein
MLSIEVLLEEIAMLYQCSGYNLQFEAESISDKLKCYEISVESSTVLLIALFDSK